MKGCLVGRQEVNGVRDLVDARQPAQRRARGDALLFLLGHITGTISLSK